MGENHRIFLIYQKITFIESINWKEVPTPYLKDPTLRKLQLPEFSSYNWEEAPNPYFTGSNLKEDPTPCSLWLQPEGGYNPFPFPVQAP